MVRDVGLAEELAQDALLAALETWPGTGVPDNPGAWLMATAKNRALDQFRRNKLLERKHEELAGEMELEHEIAAADREAALIERMDDDIGDDLLRLVFVACHPVLSTEAPAALALRSPARAPRSRGSGARRAARREARTLRAPGRDCRLPRALAHCAGDRLDAHRGALRRASADRAVARRGAQSRGRGRHGLRPGGRAGTRRCARFRAGPQALPSAARGA